MGYVRTRHGAGLSNDQHLLLGGTAARSGQTGVIVGCRYQLPFREYFSLRNVVNIWV